MLRMQVYLPEDLFVTLKSRAAVEEISMSDLVRKGLNKILRMDNKTAEPFKYFVGKCRSKIKTDSTKEIKNYYRKIAK